MTHKALVDFHANHYHPSNARFYSYGNFPLEDHLKFVNEEYLKNSTAIDASSTMVPSEKRWESPKREHISCRPDSMAADKTRQSFIAIGQLCNDIKDVQTTFELYVLSQLLLKGPNSAFYKSLVETNLGTGFGPFTGYESQIRDTMFVVSLQGVRSEDFEKIEKVYDETLEKIYTEDFAKDHIEAVLHNIELQIKHQNSNFGMNLLFNLTPLWNHDGDILRSMRINESMKILSERLKVEPKYLNELARNYLIKNNHRLILTMSPEDCYDSRQCEAEAKLLKSKIDDLSSEELEKVYEDGLALQADQAKSEPEVLPTLKIEDLKPDVDRYETKDIKISGVPVQLSIQPTNGISYYRGIINTRELNNELKMLLPIFNGVIAQMGTKSHDYRSFDRLCELKTGGLSFSSHIAETKDSVNEYEEGIVLSSYCLDKNAESMWKLWEELFAESSLDDVKRLENLVKESAGDLVNGIADSGHVYAMSSAKSLVSSSARLKESLSGLEFVGRMKNIAQSEDFGELLNKIREIRDSVMHKGHLRSAINLSGEAKNEVLEGLSGLYESLKGENGGEKLITRGEGGEDCEKAVHHVMPYAVNYCSKAILTVPYTNPEYATMRIMAKLVTNLYLFPELREKGGAYGAGANLSPEGTLTFYTYRDPNSVKTLDIFDGTWEFLKSYRFPKKDLDEAKLGVFQQIDSPVPPALRGISKFVHGLSDDDVQEQRMRLRAVTKEAILEVAEKYLEPGKKGLRIGRALLGPVNDELKERSEQGWNVLEQDDKSQARAC